MFVTQGDDILTVQEHHGSMHTNQVHMLQLLINTVDPSFMDTSQVHYAHNVCRHSRLQGYSNSYNYFRHEVTTLQ